jgi:hypothetical protein
MEDTTNNLDFYDVDDKMKKRSQRYARRKKNEGIYRWYAFAYVDNETKILFTDTTSGAPRPYYSINIVANVRVSKFQKRENFLPEQRFHSVYFAY